MSSIFIPFERAILPQMQGLGTEPAGGVLKYFENRMRACNAADAQEVRSKQIFNHPCMHLLPGHLFCKKFLLFC
jgi:hypothetical protein